MQVRWLEEFLRDDTLKLTELSTVNDPLEAIPAHCTLEKIQQLEQSTQTHLKVLCLSTRISSSAMWGYYADNHRGVSLAFNLPLNFHLDTFNEKYKLPPTARAYPVKTLSKENPWLTKVNYLPTRVAPDSKNPVRALYGLFTQKGTDWQHEKEYRIVFNRNIKHKSDGTPVCCGMRKFLSGIILGINTTQKTEATIRQQLATAKLTNIPLIKAKVHPTEYKIIASPFEDTNIEDLDNWTILNYQAEQNKQ